MLRGWNIIHLDLNCSFNRLHVFITEAISKKDTSQKREIMETLLFIVLFILAESSGHVRVSGVVGQIWATTESNIVASGLAADNSGFYTLSERNLQYNAHL